MKTLNIKPRSKAGLPPGTLVYTGRTPAHATTVSLMDYSETDVRERTIEKPADCRQFLTSDTVSWINVTGLDDTDTLQALGTEFNIHPLVLEDILHVGQRPKFEDHDDYLFLVLKMLYLHPESGEVISEQVSLLLGDRYVLTFQERPGDVFDAIRQRIRDARGRIRTMGCDYLAYALLDAIVDNYFVVLERLGEQIENLQEQVLLTPEPSTLRDLHRLRREMVLMRRNLWPLRELVSGLERSESRLLTSGLSPYVHDVYEHTLQVIETVELLRDMLSTTLDTFMTAASNRMNEVMKVLTIIATIFIPLTFIAGVYGMNFEYMPELKWPYGYVAVWMVMLLTAMAMVAFFKRKKWW